MFHEGEMLAEAGTQIAGDTIAKVSAIGVHTAGWRDEPLAGQAWQTEMSETATSGYRLERDVDGDRDSGMPPVIHVIPVIDIVDVNVIGFVPIGRPIFRPRINDTEPEAPVLESRVATHDYHWGAVDAKPVSTAKVRAKPVLRNAVASVAPAFAPGMMFMLPMLCPVVLPGISRSGV
jgi:hypothetical protein